MSDNMKKLFFLSALLIGSMQLVGCQPQPEPQTVDVELHVLSKGSTGGEVKTIQALLNGFGFYDQNGAYLAIDGIFGVKTEYALKNYQRARNLEVNGTTDAPTWNRILK